MTKEIIQAPIRLAYFNYDTNMGDALNQYLIPGVFHLPIKHSNFEECDMVGIGSIMESAIEHKPYVKAKVFGTGFIKDHKEKLDIEDCFDIHALRGRLSKEIMERNLNEKLDCVLGDAGLLTSYLFDDEVEKTYDLGIVPHYVDKDEQIFQNLAKKYPNSIIIDVMSPIKALNEIRKCRNIISTSLHGLIIADSFHIPNLWVKISERIIGSDFKYHDYYSAFGLSVEPFDLRKQELSSLSLISDNYQIRSEDVERKKQELLAAFPYQSKSKAINKEKLYTVLTYNIGGYEPVREIEEKDEDAEYLMITDVVGVYSNTWQIIVDKEIEGKSAFDKVCAIRRNVFKYAKTPICLRLDASIKIKHSLRTLIDEFIKGDYDLAVLTHPLFKTFREEYEVWIAQRDYPREQAEKCLGYFESEGYDLSSRSLLQSGFVISTNKPRVNEFHNAVDALEMKLGINGHHERIDQIPFTYLLSSKYQDLKVFLLSEQVINSYYLQHYLHGSNQPNFHVTFDLSREEKRYFRNELVTAYHLRTPDECRDEWETELLSMIDKINWENRELSSSLASRNKEYEEIRNSNSFRLGHKLMYMPGLIKRKFKK
ncbi:MAG: polysaccharide pyruvyl transferase family protein [Erysipelotrichaceae bacterium]|nr:polysaccharide pyruvyl transferase family protein [Erysipelotrichaceae bacterium]